MIHLYDYTYTGCKSCFACQLKANKEYPGCRIADTKNTCKFIAGHLREKCSHFIRIKVPNPCGSEPMPHQACYIFIERNDKNYEH